jgi:putative nucleotidyltransferase with HDIG domain
MLVRTLQPLSRANSDLTARELRIAKLSEHLAAQLRIPLERATQICTMLDQAVEFSALEGVSASAAIAAFIRDGNPWSPVAGWSEVALAQALPVMPKQASRLLRTSDDTAPSELESIAATDPVFTAKLLGAANSALHGSRMNIVSPLQAILRLGIPESRRVLLASCFSGLFASKSLQDTWDHSQSVAVRACDLAPLCGIDADSAWVAGLLHDIGRLAFYRLPGRLRVCEQYWIAAGFPAVYAESLAYGTDHAAIGAECLRAWELPAAIVEAVEYHHRPECCRSRLGALVSLAEDSSEDLWADMRRAAARKNLGVDAEGLECVAAAKSA